MMRIRTEKLIKQVTLVLAIILVLSAIQPIRAQHNSSSPYSSFGVGEIDYRSYSKNSGMGTGIGLQMPNFLNPVNPAGINIDTLMFLFDVTSSFKSSTFYDRTDKVRANNVNLRKIAMGFRATSKINLSVGISPFSSVEYNLIKQTGVEGSNEIYNNIFTGSGGLSKIYLSGAYKLNDHWSFGLKTSYLFGALNKTESSTSHTAQTNATTGKILFDFGVQYKKIINDKLGYTLGAVYGYKHNLTMKNKLILSLSLTDIRKSETTIEMPQYFGIGGSINRISGHSMWTYALDYTFHQWEGIASSAANVYFRNAHRINLGVQFTPNYRTPRYYFQKVDYQAGLFYNKSHMQIYGTQLQEFGMTVGANFPLRSRSNLFITADFGWRGGQKLIDERYMMFTAGMALSEVWFMKWAYD